MVDLRNLSDNALKAHYEKLLSKGRPLLDEMINTGRGTERPNETRTKSDPLSRKLQAYWDEFQKVVDHMRDRERLGSSYVRKRADDILARFESANSRLDAADPTKWQIAFHANSSPYIINQVMANAGHSWFFTMAESLGLTRAQATAIKVVEEAKKTAGRADDIPATFSALVEAINDLGQRVARSDVGWRADVSVSAGKTYKQLAAQLRAAARGNMASVSRAKDKGLYVNEFSIKEAIEMDRQASWLESKGIGVVTEEDLKTLRAME